MEKGQIAANWGQHLENGIKIITDVKDYSPSKEKRLLFPFVWPKRNNARNYKLGLLNRDGEIIVPAKYDTILDDCYSTKDLIRAGCHYAYGFTQENGSVKSYLGTKYNVYNFKGEKILESGFDAIFISTERRILTVKDREKGYAVYDRCGKELVPFGKYRWIDGFDSGLARVSNYAWIGIINEKGEEVLPLEYSEIWNFYGKNRTNTTAVKNKKPHLYNSMI